MENQIEQVTQNKDITLKRKVLSALELDPIILLLHGKQAQAAKVMEKYKNTAAEELEYVVQDGEIIEIHKVTIRDSEGKVLFFDDLNYPINNNERAVFSILNRTSSGVDLQKSWAGGERGFTPPVELDRDKMK